MPKLYIKPMADKDIKPGELTTREEMREVFGGGQGQGIQPCSTTPNVLLYTDPTSGEKSGYYDGWALSEDDLGPIFEYTGDGEGNQVFHGRYGPRNRAVQRHADDGRTLRVFKAVGRVPGKKTKQQRYIGMFALDKETPYVFRYAINQAGVARRVIVFRLRPDDGLVPHPEDIITPLTQTETLQVPFDTTISSLIEPEIYHGETVSRTGIPGTKVSRREASLCEAFRKMLEEHEHAVRRFQIRVTGLSSSLLTDLYDVNSHVLYEAKGTSSREAIRMAIGQLMDYRRHITPNPTLAVLTPERPHSDLQDLLKSVNVNLVYQHDDAFIGWPVGAAQP